MTEPSTSSGSSSAPSSARSPSAPAGAKADVTVSDNAERRRFEALVGTEVAGFAEYERSPGVIRFVHTEVSDAYEGQGVGSALVSRALDAVRAEGGVEVVPLCPFVHGWIDRHPDYQDLVAREQ